MRIAVISDLHGNLPAVEAFFDEMKRLKPDHIICAGDVPDPLPQAKEVWEMLKDRSIPCLRGNHEDYTIRFHKDTDKSKWWLPDFRTIALCAEHLGASIAKEFDALADSYIVRGPAGQNVAIYHASPLSNTQSFYDTWNPEMQSALQKIDATVIASGHRHVLWDKQWSNKTLISFGSLGIPQNGQSKAEYLLLDFANGQWNFEQRNVEYDQRRVLLDYKNSGWIKAGAPFSWLLYDELLTAQKRVGPFLRRIATKRHLMTTEESWQDEVKSFLVECSRWNDLVSELT